MFRIDHPSAVSVRPAPATAGTPGWFTEGDPATGILPTRVTQDWLNMAQAEFEAVLIAAGIEPDKLQSDQVAQAIATLITGAIATHEASRNHPDASTAAKGFVQLATGAEALAGTDPDKAVSPLSLASALSPKADAAAVAAALALKAPLDSPAFTGNPTVPTPTAGDNDLSIANTAFVQGAVLSGGHGTIPRAARTSNTQLVQADKGEAIGASGTWTQTFAAVATLGANWSVYYVNEGTGIVTLDPNGAETIDGRTTINVYPGESFLIQCDGLALRTIGRDRGRPILLAEFGAVTGQSAIDLTTGFGDTELSEIDIEVHSYFATGGGIPAVFARSAGAVLSSGYQGQQLDASAGSILARTTGSVEGAPLHASSLGTDYTVQIRLNVRRWRSTIGLHGPVLLYRSDTWSRSSFGNMQNSTLAAWDGIRFTGSSMGYDKIRIFGVR